MSPRLLALLLSALLLAACGAEPPHEAPTPSPRQALLDHLDEELERIDRSSPPPMRLSPPVGEGIGIGTGESGSFEEAADDE